MIRIKRLLKSFHYAYKGMVMVISEEQNIKIQITLGILVFFLGICFQITRLEWIFLFMVSGLVIILETLNSAVERVADVLKPRINTYVKEIKDIMSAAVMISALLAIGVGVLVFWPYVV